MPYLNYLYGLHKLSVCFTVIFSLSVCLRLVPLALHQTNIQKWTCYTLHQLLEQFFQILSYI